MLNTISLLALQNTIALTELQLLQAFPANWLPGNQSVVRDDSGRFASKSGVNTSLPALYFSNGEEFQKELAKELKNSFTNVDQLMEEIDKLPAKDRKEIKKFLLDPEVQKARSELASIMDEISTETGKAYRKAGDELDKHLRGEDSFSKFFKKAQEVVDSVIETAKEHPELVAIGAVSALFAVAGGAGAVALFSLPNLLGVGGAFSGLMAIASGQSASAIAGAFAVGGLSQIGFALSTYVMVEGIIDLAKSATMLFNKDFLKKMEAVAKEMQQAAEEEKEVIRATNKRMLKMGFATKDGYATDKYIARMKKNGTLPLGYKEGQQIKIAYWDA